MEPCVLRGGRVAFLGVRGDFGVKSSSLRLDHFAAAQAGRAHTHALGRRRSHTGVHRTQIHVPAPLGHVVGVADAVSRLRLLAANITLLSHNGYRFLSEVVW